MSAYELREVPADTAAPICIKDLSIALKQERKGAETGPNGETRQDPARPPPEPCGSRDCAALVREALGGRAACPARTVGARNPLNLEISGESRFRGSLLNILAGFTLGIVPLYDSVEYDVKIRAIVEGREVQAWQVEGRERLWMGAGVVPMLSILVSRTRATMESLQDTVVLQAIADNIAENRGRFQLVYKAIDRETNIATARAAASRAGLLEWQEAHATLAGKLAASYRGDRAKVIRMAVVDFTSADGRESGIGGAMAEAITTDLFAFQQFTLIERRMLERIVLAQGTDHESLFDPQTAARLGKIAGVEAIVTGTVAIAGDEVTVTARIVNVESGTMLASGAVSIARMSADAIGK